MSMWNSIKTIFEVFAHLLYANSVERVAQRRSNFPFCEFIFLVYCDGLFLFLRRFLINKPDDDIMGTHLNRGEKDAGCARFIGQRLHYTLYFLILLFFSTL